MKNIKQQISSILLDVEDKLLLIHKIFTNQKSSLYKNDIQSLEKLKIILKKINTINRKIETNF